MSDLKVSHSFCPRLAGITAHGGRHLSESFFLPRSRPSSLLRTAFNRLPDEKIPAQALHSVSRRRGEARSHAAAPALSTPPPGCTKQAFQEPSERARGQRAAVAHRRAQLSQGTTTARENSEPVFLTDTSKIQSENDKTTIFSGLVQRNPLNRCESTEALMNKG